jgi:hypothetical protein
LPGKGQALYPSDCLPSADSSVEPGSNLRSKVRAPADFEQLESAEATVKRLKIVRLGLYRKWKRDRTNGGPSLYTTPTTQQVNWVSSSSALVVDAPTVKTEEEDPYFTFKRLYPACMFDEPKAKPSFAG